MTEADICSILHIWGCVLSFLKEGNWRWGLVCWVLCANCKGLPAAVSTCLYTVSLHLCQDYVLFVFLSWVGTDRWTNIEGYIPSSAGVWIGWFHLISFPFLNNHSFIHSFILSFIHKTGVFCQWETALIRVQFMGVGSLLPPCVLQGLNSSHQIWWQVSLHTKPSHWLPISLLNNFHIMTDPSSTM